MSRNAELGGKLRRRDFLWEAGAALAAGAALVAGLTLDVADVAEAQEKKENVKFKEELEKLQKKFPDLDFSMLVEPKPGKPAIIVVEPGTDVVGLAEYLARYGNSYQMLVENRKAVLDQPAWQTLLEKPDVLFVLNELDELRTAAGYRKILHGMDQTEEKAAGLRPGTLGGSDDRRPEIEKKLEKAKEGLEKRLVQYMLDNLKRRRLNFVKTRENFLGDTAEEALTRDQLKKLANLRPPLFVIVMAKLDDAVLGEAARYQGVGVVRVRKR